MKTQICPKCGEENPGEAVICWACCTPLDAGKARAPAPSPADETPMGAKVKRQLSDAAPFAAMAGLAASGWLPRKTRLPALGASASVLFRPMLLDKWREHFADDKPDKTRMDESQNSPAARVAKTILYYALREKATATRIEVDNRMIKVFYQIEGEWHNQMKIPLHSWKPLRQQLLRYARQGEFDFGLAGDGPWHRITLKLTDFNAQLEANPQGETLRLQFESALPDEFSMTEVLDMPPDVECLECREFNPFDALWCWNCGASVKQPISSRERKYAVYNKIALASLAALTSSGWWNRRARLPVLSAGVLSLAALFAFNKWEEGQGKREEKRIEAADKRGVISSWEAPAVRLTNQILLYAIQRHISTIRVRESGNVIVAYDVGDERREQFVLPGWVWLATREQILNRAHEGVTCQGKKHSLHAELSSDVNGETLDLRLDARE